MQADRAAGRPPRSWARVASGLGGAVPGQTPDLLPELRYVMAAHDRLGKDPNGSSTQTEQLAWLDGQGVTDRGERDAYQDLFHAIDAELSVIRAERHDECPACEKTCWRPRRPDGSRECRSCGVIFNDAVGD